MLQGFPILVGLGPILQLFHKVEFGQTGDDLTAVIHQAEGLDLCGAFCSRAEALVLLQGTLGLKIPVVCWQTLIVGKHLQQICLADAFGHLQVTRVPGGPVQPSENLQEFPVGFCPARGYQTGLRLHVGCIEDCIHPFAHAVEPGAWPKPLGDGEEAIFGVLRGAKYPGFQVFFHHCP